MADEFAYVPYAPPASEPPPAARATCKTCAGVCMEGVDDRVVMARTRMARMPDRGLALRAPRVSQGCSTCGDQHMHMQCAENSFAAQYKRLLRTKVSRGLDLTRVKINQRHWADLGLDCVVEGCRGKYVAMERYVRTPVARAPVRAPAATACDALRI